MTLCSIFPDPWPMFMNSHPPLVHSDPMLCTIYLMGASDISSSTPYEPLRPNMTLCGILPDPWPMFMNSLPPLAHSDPMLCTIYLMGAPDISNSTPYDPLRPNMNLCGILPDPWPLFIKSLPPLAHSGPILCTIYLMGDMTFQTLPPMTPSSPT